MSQFPKVDIISAIRDPLLINDDISPQKEVLLRALYGLALPKVRFNTVKFDPKKGFYEISESAEAFYCRVTRRARYKPEEYNEASFYIGARGGKSDKLAGNVAVYESCLRQWKLSRGEIGNFIVVARDMPQAHIVHGYVQEKIVASPVLSQMLPTKEDTRFSAIRADTVEITSVGVDGKPVRIAIQVLPCNYASIRGYTSIGSIGDEFAVWRDAKTSLNPAKEVLRALRSRMATQPNAKLIKITSPLTKFGLPWKEWQNQVKGKNKHVLVAKAPSWEVNPVIDRQRLLRDFEEDPVMFWRDYGAEFMDSVSALLAADKVDACPMPGVKELPPASGKRYFAALDAAFESDDFVFGIGHRDGDRVTVDVLMIWEPTKDEPVQESVVLETIAMMCRRYGLSEVTGDQFCAAMIRQRLAKLGIAYNEIPFSQNSKQQIYQTLKMLVNTGNLSFPDDPRAAQQLKTLEATLGSMGNLKIQATRGAKDDVATVIALLCFMATQTAGNAEAWIELLSGDGLGGAEPDSGEGMTRCADCGKMIPFGHQYHGIGAGLGQCMACRAEHGNPTYKAVRLPESEPRPLDMR